MSYEPRKAAQLIAYLILKSGANALNVLKAVKLVYLTDRESIKRFGFPVLDERRCSMPHGPVNSVTYSFINGEHDDEAAAQDWYEFIKAKENHLVSLADEFVGEDSLDELSDADIECADAVWDTFGHLTQWQLRDWTHVKANVPEWEDPNGGSSQIPLTRIMVAVGVNDAEGRAREVEDFQRVDRLLKAARVH